MSRKRKRRQQFAAGQSAIDALDAELSAFAELPISDLRTAWVNRFDNDPPTVRSRDLLLRQFAWRIQAEAYGGLDAKTERKLAAIAQALDRDGTYQPQITRTLSPGIVVTREWKGVVHKVTVTESGFQHFGKTYRSLSDIARTITGTRWSGPRFFGLEQNGAGARGAKS